MTVQLRLPGSINMAKTLQLFVFVVLFITWSADSVSSQNVIEDVESETVTMTTEEEVMMTTEPPTRIRTTTSGGLGGFFKKLGADLNKGGRIIQETVSSSSSFLRKGFEDVRDRIIPTKETPTTTTERSTLMEVKTDLDPVENDAANPTMNSFVANDDGDNNQREEEDDRPIWDVAEDKKEVESTTEVLDNRFLIDAPTFCPKGQMKMRNGQCRSIA